jgi:hypothetical protein
MDEVFLVIQERGFGDQRFPDATASSSSFLQPQRVEQDGTHMVRVVGAIQIALIDKSEGRFPIGELRCARIACNGGEDGGLEEEHGVCSLCEGTFGWQVGGQVIVAAIESSEPAVIWQQPVIPTDHIAGTFRNNWLSFPIYPCLPGSEWPVGEDPDLKPWKMGSV